MTRRVVFEHGPALFGLTLVDEASLTPELRAEDGTTYYLAQRKVHYDLYKRAVTDWGAAPRLDPRQR